MRVLRQTALLLVTSWVATGAGAATEYTGDGSVSSRAELQRWYINLARYNPEAEADALGLYNTTPGGHPGYDVCEDSDGANDFGATPAAWAPWTNSLPPLAPNAALSLACAKHCQDMGATGEFSHDSPSSTYYPLGSSPYQRQVAEGYANVISGYYENLATGWKGANIGYPPVGYVSVTIYEDLFIDDGIGSRGHRKAILNSYAREIGLANARLYGYQAPYYTTTDYDAQDYGCRTGQHFFTDTLFCDANANGFYEEGEGVGGVQVHLWDGAQELAWYDRSEPSGSFAVPIADATDGRLITVQFVNPSPAAVTLSLPVGADSFSQLLLGAGATVAYGTFVQPATVRNVGFRDLTPRQTLNQALDNIRLAFQTGGDGTWFGQSQTAHSGGDAAQGARLGDGQSAWMEATVSGPGRISFWWRASSEAGRDELRFLVDGVAQPDSLSGESGWVWRAQNISNGTHVLRWVYAKDAGGAGGADCAWVDQVVFGRPGTAPVDFDGDGVSDPASYNSAGGRWDFEHSTAGAQQATFGFAGTAPVSGDFDGDGLTDYGVYHAASGMWYLTRSRDGFLSFPFGYAGTVPVTGDFDGDGRCDAAVYCAASGAWHFSKSRDGYAALQFGFAGTVPVAADFDGDRRCDFGVYNPGTGDWYLMKSSQGFSTRAFGFSGTEPVARDYDGDGRADQAVYYAAAGTWYFLMSRDGFATRQFGFSGTSAVSADYDGDGRADFGVHHPPTGVCYLMKSTEGFAARTIGPGGGVAVTK